ncbi:MAG TPA: hypothetical protein VM008_17010 [Phycisphaerae bacterium]|nr:hypothetical protein [Phycisphaerae bacterium]
MTTTETPTSPTPPSPLPQKKRRGRWWKILLIFVLLLLLVVLLAPTLLSTGAGTRFILGQINKRIAGTVEADNISLGWFSGASISGLRLKDPEGQEVFNIPSINTGLTLLNAINKSFDSLNLVLRGKNANLITNADGTSNLSRALASRTPPTPPAATPAQPPATSSNPPTIHATIDAQFDSITCTSPNAAPVIIQNLATNGILDTNGGTTDLRIKAQAQTGNNNPATITAAMNGNFFDHGKLKPLGAIGGTAEAHVQSIDLAALAPFLATAGLKLTLAGTSGLDFNLAQNNGAQTATAKITINQLVASGDLLKGDTFRRNLVTITLNSTLKGDAVDLHPLQLDAEAINAQLTGNLQTSGTTTGTLPPLSVQSTLDVAALKKELPHLLGDVPDTQVTIALTGIADTAKKLFTVTADSNIAEKDLASNAGNSIALAKGSVLSWGDGPDDIHAAASINWQRIQAILGKRMPEGTTIQGTRTINLHLSGAMAKAPGLGAFKGFTLDPTTIGWDQIATEGLTLGKADIGMQLKDGILTLTPTDIPANEGTMRIAGRVDLNQNPAAYILDKQPQGTPLIKGLQLNKDIAAGPLAFLPLAWGAGKNSPTLGSVGGQLNVTLQEAFIPLDADAFKTKGTTSGSLNISNLSTSAPVFTQLLTTLGPIAKITQPDLLTIHGGSIPDTPFALANGKVSYQNLTLGTAKESLQFSGSVGLDKSLAMSVTITASGMHIPVPISLGGTTAKPTLTLAPGAGGDQNIGNTVQDLTSGLNQLLNNKKKKK